MKKTIALMACLGLAFCGLWIAEPGGLNPFASAPQQTVQSIGGCTAPDSSGRRTHIKAAADALIGAHMEKGDFLGVTAGILQDGCPLYQGAAGLSHKWTQRPMQPATLGRIASITKPMTAIAIMQLYEQGRIDLDAPIQTYLPDFPKPAEGTITVRRLMSHMAGIAHYSSKLDALSFTAYETLGDAVEAIAQRELASQPGTAFQYSSYGYTLLGAVIEAVSGLSYEDYMTRHIWSVAGMPDTRLERRENRTGEAKARLYIKVKSSFIRSPYTDLSIIHPAGGVQSNAKDLLAFADAIIENRLIERKTLEMMIDVSGSRAGAAGDDPYGLGWTVYHHPDHGRIIAHSGAQPGANAYLAIYLDKKTATAVLSNAFGTKSATLTLSRTLADLALGG